MQLTPILKELEHYFISQQSIAGAQLQEGISATAIREKIVHLNLSFPPEVFELFEWKNGLKDQNNLTIKNSRLFPFGIFNSFDSCLYTCQTSIEEGYYEKKFFPILESGGGDYLVINCDPEDAYHGYIFMHSLVLHGNEPCLYYESLSSHFQCVLDCFKAGGYFFTNGLLGKNNDIAGPTMAKCTIDNEGD